MILYPHKGTTSVLDAAAVYEKIQVYPHQVTDFKGLCGDTTDNIPGVPRIGAKTASALLAKYDSMLGTALRVRGSLQQFVASFSSDLSKTAIAPR